ncbi:O-antigen translocase [Massilia alkalitolerans]|uniref:O-antigen translocase n=1 Tax=Massilia alkalitolerans TaxID=286638 RepID=UPI0003F6508C|nr:O-antigen translocase [Massilia alkalitolerans]
MTLIKTGLWNGLAVVIKMLTMLGINKILSIFVGPAGYGALGQFQNAVQMMTTFTSGAISVGVTKYTAEYAEDEVAQRQLWRTAGTITLTGSILGSTVIALYSKELAVFFLKQESYAGVFLWFAATLVLLAFNTLLLAILNGKKELRSYVFANIAGSIFALIVTAVMVYGLGLYGALVALAIYQSIAFFITLFLCQKASWFKYDVLFGRVDRKTAVNLAKYAAMAVTSAVCVPMSHILVRNHLGETLGWEAAGLWEATWRLSAAYLMLVTTTLSVYYLPRFAEISQWSQLKAEIVRGYKVVLPFAAASGLAVYLLRDQIIPVLFTREFAPMRDLFAWQMIGDTLKIGGWILSYVMLGKAMFKLFMITEVIFAAGFFGLTWLLTGMFGIEGVAIAHAANYALYWLTMAVAIQRFFPR